MHLHCPNCREEFKGEPWEDGECPGCTEPYSWEDSSYELDEGYDSEEDSEYVASWVIPVWVNY